MTEDQKKIQDALSNGEIVVLIYYTWKKKTLIKNMVLTTKEIAERYFKTHKKFGIRQYGKPTCCNDCQYTACWEFGKVSRCTEKKMEIKK